jgi:putative copper export protein
LILTTPSQSGITFVYWASLFVHLFGAVAWLGGILFLTGVTRPIFDYFGQASFDLALRIKVRFLGFTWMLVWTVLVTGLILLLWSTRFLLFDFSDSWRILAHLKILLFLLLFAVNVALRSTYRELEAASAEIEPGAPLSAREVLLWRTRMFEQIEVWAAIFLLLIVSWMQIL